MANKNSPFKPDLITARVSGRTPISAHDASALADRGMTARVAFPRSPFHHLIPRQLLKNKVSRLALENAKINIDDYAVQICQGEHTAIHSMDYNLLWEIFFYTCINPSREMILSHMEWMKVKFKITEHTQPYVKIS